jgi:hypothetical protein
MLLWRRNGGEYEGQGKSTNAGRVGKFEPKEREHLEYLSIDGRITLLWNLRE